MKLRRNLSKLIVLVLLFCIPLCSCKHERKEERIPEGIAVLPFDSHEYWYLNDSDSVYRRISMQDSFRMFEEKAECLLLFSRPTCGICNIMAPEINSVCKEMNRNVYYVDVEDEQLIQMSSSEREELFDRLFEYLDPILPPDPEDPSKKTMYVPLLVRISEGVITGSMEGFPQDIEMPEEPDEWNETERKKLADRIRTLAE